MNPKRKPRVGIYARVSTHNGQTVENQLRELRGVAKLRNWNVVMVCEDTASGAKGKDQRPGLRKLHRAAMRREIDIVAAWSLDRIGRSTAHLVTLLDELHAVECELYLHKEAIDTTTPTGKLMFNIIGAIAEFERTLIRERVKSGLARAKSQGKRLGRPPAPPKKKREIAALRKKGLSMAQIAAQVGVGVGTVHRALQEAGQ